MNDMWVCSGRGAALHGLYVWIIGIVCEAQIGQ